MLLSGDFDTHAAWQLKANLRSLDVFQADNGSAKLNPANPDIRLWKKAIGQRLRYSGAKLRKNFDQAGVEISKWGVR